MQNKIPLGIRSLQHIGIPVQDIARSKAFYERLGFVSAMEAPFYIEGEKGTCIMLQQAGIVVELYQLPEAQLQEVRNRSNGRIDHIAFDVEDIDKTYETALAFDLNPNQPEPVFLSFWSKGCKYFTINGPDGEILEFNQIC